MAILLAVVTGATLGYVLERGEFCFHSTLRGLVSAPRQLDLFRAYLVTLLVATPVVNGMIALDWIAPWIPPFAWQANVVGGLIFGMGMVIASTCITGLFYKLGHGMLGTLVGLVAWSAGDIITYRGPLSPLRAALNSSPITAAGISATVSNLFGLVGIAALVTLGLLAAAYLWRSPRHARGKYWGWLPLGFAVGTVTSAAWLLARSGGSNYTFGTSSIPTNTFIALTQGGVGGSIWVPLALVSLVPGAYIAARRSDTLWMRGETWRRLVALAGGGFLMGIGAGIAGGCNLGHSLVGIPLLSLGSITTTLSMGVGVLLADRAFRIGRNGRSSPAVAEYRTWKKESGAPG